MILPVVLLALALALMLFCAELFTNGVEWLGRRLRLGEAAVGSVLAAVGTAMPETLIPVVAIVFVGTEASREVGVGAILGAPFMLGTLAFFMTGAAALAYRPRRGHPFLKVNRVIVSRDLTYFLAMYIPAVATSFLPHGWVRAVVVVGLLIGYAVYLRANFAEAGVIEPAEQLLRLHWLHAHYFIKQEPGEEVTDFAARREHRLHGPPRLRVILLQVAIALGGIIGVAHLFVHEIELIAEHLHWSPLIMSLIIVPVATELPEKFNSVVWIRQSKDTLAMGNITGAMVFQGSIPVSLGIALTPWELKGATLQAGAGLVSVGLAVVSALIVLAYMRVGGKEARVTPWALIAGLPLYLVFLG